MAPLTRDESRIPNPLTKPVDDFRPMKVVCIGAGMCGIAIGCLMPAQIKNLELVIYDKNPEVGGTWYENHYPGVRPDLTPHTYQYTFASNPNWSRFFPPGAEFENYLKAVAKKFDVYKHMKFRTQFKSAKWIEDTAQWELTLMNLETAEVFTDHCDVVIKSTGFVNDWRWPAVPGREDFKGTMLHTANWDDDFDPTDKKVAVLGYGSTGVQVTPAIQPIVKHLDHYVRGKVWVPPGGGTCPEELMARGADKNFDHSEEERKEFAADPKKYLAYRKRIEIMTNKVQPFFLKGTDALAWFENMLDTNMQKTLASKPGMYDTLKPSYPPGCRRLIMGQAWLECLCQDNATLIPKDVQRFTEKGIIDEEGTEREYDAIICATGFDTALDSGTTPFIGRDGISLKSVWNPDPIAYFSIAPPDMPNMFIMFGPNSAPAAGSIVHTFEGAAAYIIKCVQKMQREYIKTMVVKPQALKNWLRHVDYQHSTTVLTSSCRTWFKRNKPDGRVITSWPGSALASYKGWENPRFEDFDYTTYLDDDNTMAWLGNGFSYNEANAIEDSADYMDYNDTSKILSVDTTNLKPYEDIYYSHHQGPWSKDKGPGKQLNVEYAKAVQENIGDSQQKEGVDSGIKDVEQSGDATKEEKSDGSTVGMQPDGTAAALGDKVEPEGTPHADAEGNVTLPGDDKKLMPGEAHGLNVNI